MERRPRLEFIRICLLDALGESARRVEYRGRERIYIRGGASDEVFILTAGAVKLSRESPERREIILSFLHSIRIREPDIPPWACGEPAPLGCSLTNW